VKTAKANQYITIDILFVSIFSRRYLEQYIIIIFYRYVLFFFLCNLLRIIIINIEHFLFHVLKLQIVYVHR